MHIIVSLVGSNFQHFVCRHMLGRPMGNWALRDDPRVHGHRGRGNEKVGFVVVALRLGGGLLA